MFSEEAMSEKILDNLIIMVSYLALLAIYFWGTIFSSVVRLILGAIVTQTM